MGVFDAATWAIKGRFDVFDRAIGVIEDIEEMLPPVEYHAPDTTAHDGEGHYYDPVEGERLALESAKEWVRQACTVVQEVLGGIE